MDPGSHQDQVWPRVTDDCGNRTVESLPGSLAACCIPVTLSAMSCLGAILIRISYAVLKDIRKEAQTIITALAFADFGVFHLTDSSRHQLHTLLTVRKLNRRTVKFTRSFARYKDFVTLLGYWGTFV